MGESIRQAGSGGDVARVQRNRRRRQVRHQRVQPEHQIDQDSLISGQSFGTVLQDAALT
jgi:hypothetical protein